MKNKIIVFSSLAITALMFATPVFAAAADVTKIETFVKSIIQVLVTIAGLVAAGFFEHGDDCVALHALQQGEVRVRRLLAGDFRLADGQIGHSHHVTFG